MPKPHTFPFIFDETKCITISDLKKLKYIKPNTNKTGNIRWTNSRGVETGSITIQSKIKNDLKVLIFDYKCNDKSYNYTIPLVTIPSNLGKGKVWYFICPFTYKRCRKLHLIDCHFVHRSAVTSGVYAKQLHTKKWREMERIYGHHFDIDNYYQELYSKHFKKFYNGKPTKRYLKLMQKINQAERISISDIERLYLI